MAGLCSKFGVEDTDKNIEQFKRIIGNGSIIKRQEEFNKSARATREKFQKVLDEAEADYAKKGFIERWLSRKEMEETRKRLKNEIYSIPIVDVETTRKKGRQVIQDLFWKQINEGLDNADVNESYRQQTAREESLRKKILSQPEVKKFGELNEHYKDAYIPPEIDQQV